MNVYALHAGRKAGKTVKAVRMLYGRINEFEDSSYEETFLNSSKLPYCIGCLLCISDGKHKCPHSKIVQPIVQQMLQADLIVLSTPVYAMQLGGALKSMIDHLSYMYHRPELMGKQAVIVSSTAGAGLGNVRKYLDKQFLRFIGINRVYNICFRGDPKSGIPSNLGEKIQNIAQRIIRDKGKVEHPSINNITSFNVFKASSMMSQNSLPADYRYWQSKGWHNTAYYYSAKINVFKRLWGAIIYRLMVYMNNV